MNFKYPISKEDGTDYKATELYGILAKETSGHYLLGSYQFWHGGIHFTHNTIPHCVLEQPIRCIADGEVIAYRINQKYPETKLNTTTLQYSSSFCLVKHEYKSPSEPVKEAAKDPTKLNDTWQGKKIRTLATGFASYSDEAYSKDRKVMPKGLMLEILQVNNTTKKIGNTEYYLTKAKVLQAVEANTTNKTSAYAKDEEIWFAGFKKDGSIQASTEQKNDLFKDVTPQDWTNKTITLAKTFTGYKALSDASEKSRELIVIPEKTALQIKEVQTTLVNDYHYSKVTASTALKMQDAHGKTLTREWQANQEFWLALTDQDGYIPLIANDKELYTDTTPPPEPKTNKLTFYSLYMHLLPYEEYPVKAGEITKQYKVLKSISVRNKFMETKDLEDSAQDKDTVLGSISKDTIVNLIGQPRETEDGKYCLIQGIIEGTTGKITQDKKDVAIGKDGFWLAINKEISTGKRDIYAQELPSPKREYPSYWAQQVTAKVITAMDVRQAPTSKGIAGATLGSKLAVGDEVTYINQKIKEVTLDKTKYLMAECKLVKEKADFTKKGITTFWAIVDSKHMTTTKAEPTCFETVETAYPVKISAGDPVGYLGLYEVPSSPIGGKSDKPKKQVHIEVFTTTDEAELTKFLNNEAGLTGGKQYIQIAKDTILQKNAPSKDSKATQPKTTSELTEAYYKTQQQHIISPDNIKQVNGLYQITVHENKQSVTGYLSPAKAHTISQYDWIKLGFKIVKEENTTTDGSVSTKTDGFIDQQDMTSFYQDVCKEMDSKENGGDGDGKLSLPELRNALKDPVLCDKWSKLIAYHPTEWQAEGTDEKWKRLGTEILAEKECQKLVEHEKERITKLVFWEKVPELKGKKLAYHFHPVAFVEHLYGGGCGDPNCFCSTDVKLTKDFIIAHEKIRNSRVSSCNNSGSLNKVEIIVLHRTEGGAASGTLNHMHNSGYGAHFVIDNQRGEDGVIHHTISLNKKGSHMGAGQFAETKRKGWGNSNSIGIEVCGYSYDAKGIKRVASQKGWGDHAYWEPVTDTQAQSIACLIRYLIKYFNLTLDDVKFHERLCSKTPQEGEFVFDAMMKYW